MNEPSTARPPRIPSREIATAEAQIATADEQIAEMQAKITEAETQIEVMEEEIRTRKKFIRAETRRMTKLAERRAVFIDAASSLRKLDLP